MRIHQFNLQFNPEEDRVLFRLNTVSGESFRFFLTRRFVKLLWSVLGKLLRADFERRQPEQARHSADILAFEQAKTLQNADFSQSYQEPAVETRFPLGEEPILLSRIQVKQTDVAPVLCLSPTRGQGIEIPAHFRFLHTFRKMIRDVVTRAEWDLSLDEGYEFVSPNDSPTVH